MDAIDRMIAREGPYVDHPADRGGPTCWGITLSTLRWWRQREDVTATDVQHLTKSEARQIYDRRYWTGPRIAELPEPLRELVFDCAVLHGVRQSLVWLQHALGVPLDARIGPVTLGAAQTADVDAVRRSINRQRLAHFGRLLRDDPRQCVFAAGWLARVGEFL